MKNLMFEITEANMGKMHINLAHLLALRAHERDLLIGLHMSNGDVFFEKQVSRTTLALRLREISEAVAFLYV